MYINYKNNFFTHKMSDNFDEFMRTRYPDTYNLSDEELERQLNEARERQGVVGTQQPIDLTNQTQEFIDIVNFLESDAILNMSTQDFLIELDRLNRLNDMRREMILEEELEQLRIEREQMMLDQEQLMMEMEMEREEFRERIEQLENNTILLNRIMQENPDLFSQLDIADNYDLNF